MSFFQGDRDNMSQDMETGMCCSWCGVYFCGYHDYPVVCWDCAKGVEEKVLRVLCLSVATLPEL